MFLRGKLLNVDRLYILILSLLTFLGEGCFKIKKNTFIQECFVQRLAEIGPICAFKQFTICRLNLAFLGKVFGP